MWYDCDEVARVTRTDPVLLPELIDPDRSSIEITADFASESLIVKVLCSRRSILTLRGHGPSVVGLHHTQHGTDPGSPS